MSNDYSNWGPFLGAVDEYRVENGLPVLTAEQVAGASKVMDRVIETAGVEVLDVACLPDNLIEVMLTKINDIDLDLGLITATEHEVNHLRINTVLKEHRLTLTLGVSDD